MMNWDIMVLMEPTLCSKDCITEKGLKLSVEKLIKACYQCQSTNKQVVKYATLHFDAGTFSM